jgi:uncharacterized membrane protein
MNHATRRFLDVWVLRSLLLLYFVASAVHFTHNAENVAVYPNLPAWVTRSSVYVTWLGITTIGAVGYLCYRLRRVAIGLLLLGVYAAVGFDGLLHYTLAPMHVHTRSMNVTIWFEVVVAALLLAHISILVRERVIHGGIDA